MQAPPDISLDPAPGSKRRWAALIVATAAFVMSQFYRISTAVISPHMAAELQMSGSDLSFVAAAFFYSFAFCQIPLSVTLDRIGPRMIMGVLGIVAVIGGLTFAWADSHAMSITGRMLLGVGTASNLMGPLALVAAWFPINRFAFLTGMLVAVGNVGGLMASTPFQLLIEEFGWRMSYSVISAINAVLVILIFWLIRDRPEGKKAPSRASGQPFFEGLKFFASYTFFVFGLSSFVRYGYLVALQALWATPFMLYGLGLTPLQMANGIFAISLGLIVGLPLWGKLSDQILMTRKHLVWPLLIIFGLVSVALCMLPAHPNLWLVYALFFAFGFTSSSGQLMYAHVKELVPPEQAGQAMVGVNLFTMLGGGLFTQILGMVLSGEPASLTSPSDFSVLFWIGASSLVIVALFYTTIGESRVMQRGNKK